MYPSPLFHELAHMKKSLLSVILATQVPLTLFPFKKKKYLLWLL